MVYNIIEESRELGITIKPGKEEIKKKYKESKFIGQLTENYSQDKQTGVRF